MKLLYTVLFIVISTAVPSFAQNEDSIQEKSVFDKKMYFGGTFANNWSTLKGENLPEMFTKPSLGGLLKAEFRPINLIGISLGFGYQQRGAGILMPDSDKSLGNPDSTYRLRFRSNCVEIPLLLELRTPKDVVGGVRISGGIGVVQSFNVKTQTVFHSVEDGFHDINDVTNTLSGSDLLISGALGVDINSADACIFRVQAIVQKGTKNIYNDQVLYPNFVGKNSNYGIQISWLY